MLPLSKGQLKATTAKYYRISGQSTQNKGVLPDLEYPGIFSVDDFGESSLPEAMAWDKINSIPYQTYYKMDDLLLLLKNRHIVRNRMSQDYQYFLERRERSNEMRQKKIVSLSEQKRRKELEEADQWRLELENTLRLTKGEPPLEKLSDLNEDKADDAHSSAIDVKDPLMVEAAEVMVDFVELLKKNVVQR